MYTDDLQLLNISQVAKLMGVHRVTVYRRVRDRSDFPAPIRGIGAGPRWRRSAIAEYLDRLEAESNGRTA